MPRLPSANIRDRPPRRDIALEEYVGDLYRALGYDVTRDVELLGNQIDLLAKKTVAGLGHVAVMIEVKQRTEALVSKEEVNRFLETAGRLLARGTVSKAVMVTDTSYTRHARAAADGDSRIELTDVRTIARHLLAAEAPLAQAIHDFDTRAISKHYIPLAIDSRSTDNPPTSSETLLERLTVDREHIILLADYGAGKTTTLERLKVLAAQRYLDHRIPDIPLLFRLKDFSRYGSLEDYVVATVRAELQMELPVAHFWTLLSGGQFLIMLDGFDEISATTDEHERADYLVAISPLLFGFSPSILSTRPSYFLTDTEYRSAMDRARGVVTKKPPGGPSSAVPAYDRAALLTRDLRRRYQTAAASRLRASTYLAVNLQPLSSKQIDDYLATFSADFLNAGFKTASQVRRLIDSVYDLSDLMTRPIILDMIVATMLHGALGRSLGDTDLGPSYLYESYTDSKLAVDWDKAESRQQGLTIEDRKRFAEECAVYIHDNKTNEVPLSDARDIASQFVPDGSRSFSRERVLTDLRTCSFLTTAPDGGLRFVHKSFQEFFVSRRLYGLVGADDWSMLDELLPREVCYFLGGYMVGNDQFRKKIVSRLARELHGGESDAVVRRNLATAVLYSARELHHLKWSDVSIVGAVLSRLDVVQSRLYNVELRNIRVDRLGLVASEVKIALSLERAGLIELSQSKGAVEVAGVTKELRVTGGSWVALRMEGVTTRLFDISDSRVRIIGREGVPSDVAHLTIRNAVSSMSALVAGVLDAASSALHVGESVVIAGHATRDGEPEKAYSLQLKDSIGVIDGVADGIADSRRSLLWVARGPSGLSDRTVVRCSSGVLISPDMAKIIVESEGSVIIGLNWSGGDLPSDVAGLVVGFRRSGKATKIDQARPALFHISAPPSLRDAATKVLMRFRHDLLDGKGVQSGHELVVALMQALKLQESHVDDVVTRIDQALGRLKDTALRFRQLAEPTLAGVFPQNDP